MNSSCISKTIRIAVFSSFIGSQAIQAQYTPDTSNQPIWQSADPEPESGADWSDHDLDGLPAWYESWLGTNPLLYDTDYDGINDGDEVATTGTNPLHWDTDNNGQSDLADFYAANSPIESESPATADNTTFQDADSDGLGDEFETSSSNTNPNNSDSDGNGRSDYDDYYYPVSEPDSDSDGVSDAAETSEGTNPMTVDTDGDGLTDGEETNIFNTDPNNAYSLSAQYTDWHMVDLNDSDGGGIPDRIEQYHGLNIYDANDDTNGDLDGDGVTNAESYENGTDLDANITETYDRDGDGMTDVWEVANALNPDDASDNTGDPDGDGATNLEEFQRGTDPHVSDINSTEESTNEPIQEETDKLNLTYDTPIEEPVSEDAQVEEPQAAESSAEEEFWTWGNTLGIIGVVASIAGFVTTSPIVAGVGLVAGLWWLANEIIDYNSDLPDINDSPVWP